MLAFLEGPELILVLVVVLVLFGGAKLPKLARSLGDAQREFRKGTEGDRSPVPDEARKDDAASDHRADPGER